MWKLFQCVTLREINNYTVSTLISHTLTFLSWCRSKWGEGVHLEWLIVDGGGGPLARGGRSKTGWRVLGGGGRGRGGRSGGGRGGEGLATLSGHEVPDEDCISTADDPATVQRELDAGDGLRVTNKYLEEVQHSVLTVCTAWK